MITPEEAWPVATPAELDDLEIEISDMTEFSPCEYHFEYLRSTPSGAQLRFRATGFEGNHDATFYQVSLGFDDSPEPIVRYRFDSSFKYMEEQPYQDADQSITEGILDDLTDNGSLSAKELEVLEHIRETSRASDGETSWEIYHNDLLKPWEPPSKTNPTMAKRICRLVLRNYELCLQVKSADVVLKDNRRLLASQAVISRRIEQYAVDQIDEPAFRISLDDRSNRKLYSYARLFNDQQPRLVAGYDDRVDYPKTFGGDEVSLPEWKNRVQQEQFADEIMKHHETPQAQDVRFLILCLRRANSVQYADLPSQTEASSPN